MSKRNILIAAIVGGVVILIACAGIIALVLVTRDSDNDDDNKTSTSQENRTEDNDDDSNSDDDSNESDSGKYNACKLLTKKDVEDIVDTGIQEPEESNTSTSTSCSYTSNFESLSDKLFTMNVLITTSSKKEAKQSFESAKLLGGEDGVQDANSLGVDAYVVPNVFGTSQLNLLKDDSWILITTFGDEEDNQYALEAAKIILKRM